MGTVFERFSLSLSSISMVQIWEVLHPWLHPTLQIHDSRLFLYKWALEIARKGKSCRSFFVLGATTGCDSYCSPQSTGIFIYVKRHMKVLSDCAMLH
ncbi:uncharacterized protein LOC130992308 isoform X2 [Salvia miltiorrhiza]|uniref:uncharacterized protein LOC130992308 isoform X2 n=1 Tax=Salvia miltiorrhiza TaxID=226208 RepID=UPI0025AD3EEE|nr:uncharacterized protein LOC130992308 isoform X2 [Salvia miltiorrhiza]